MEQSELCQTLIDRLHAAAAWFDSEQDAELYQDWQTVCTQLSRSGFRIAVFGPFNYGKSTLLNAMLGERALPIDLIPTTGAAITVKYGEMLRSRIVMTDGRVIEAAGTEVLKQFAILDDQRRMREDVAAVEVFCPHPFLQMGVEFLDLPGTDDQEEQDALVREQLLSADLVVQVLDGRKLMTLVEREQLRDWLLDRGIETVVFAVNFLNLMVPEEQKQVFHRLRFVAESFRTRLPVGISNLYRVDALPALRARLKGEMAAAQTAGLPMFESALQAIAQRPQSERTDACLPRLQAIALRAKQALQARAVAIAAQLEAAEQTREKKAQIEQKARKLIRQGFTTSANKLRQWLALPHLLDRYQTDIASALKQFDFPAWERHFLQPAWEQRQQEVVGWVYKACDFFKAPRPADLTIAFPNEPDLTAFESPNPVTDNSSADLTSSDVAPVALATGLGALVGGPIGAVVLGGASYLLSQTDRVERSTVPTASNAEAVMERACSQAARDYLTQFSRRALAALQQYETESETILGMESTPASAPTDMEPQQAQLRSLQAVLDELDQALAID